MALALSLVVLAGPLAQNPSESAGFFDQWKPEDLLRIFSDGAEEAADESVGGLAYSLLDEDAKKTYLEMYTGISAMKDEFSVHDKTGELIEPALFALLRDHPEFWWHDGISTYQKARSTTQLIKPRYNISLEERPHIEARIDAAFAEYQARLPESAGDYDKLKTAYEYIIERTNYSFDSENNQNIRSVFVTNSSVCAGYSKALQYLLRRSGVWCAYIEGTIPLGQGMRAEEERHSWNIVCVDGSYVHVDVTWGDPSYTNEQGQAQDAGVVYDYLCLSDEQMLRCGHIPDQADLLPACTSEQYDYYRLNAALIAPYSDQAVLDFIWAHVDSPLSALSFKLGDDESFNRACMILFEQGMADSAITTRGGISQGSVAYSYAADPALRIIRLFW